MLNSNIIFIPLTPQTVEKIIIETYITNKDLML